MSSRSDSTSEPAWLLRDGSVVAALEVADTRTARRKGLLRRDGIEGALLLKPARSVHTIGMRFALDVAFCDESMIVLEVRTMAPNRVSPIRWRARCVIEAEAGKFDRWNLRPGQQLEVKV